MRKLFTICLASLQIACAAEDFNNKSYEWDIYPVPADAGDGMVWKLHPQSDDFNYVADEKDKGKEFYAKWTDFYHPNDEGGLYFDDPEIGVEWPMPEGMTKEDLIISEKDHKWGGIKDLKK